MMKSFAIAASIAIFFLIYWLLPNGKMSARAVLSTAVIMGLMSEALKYAYILALPWLEFSGSLRPFCLSVSLMFWAFLSGLLLLTGAHLSARQYRRRGECDPSSVFGVLASVTGWTRGIETLVLFITRLRDRWHIPRFSSL